MLSTTKTKTEPVIDVNDVVWFEDNRAEVIAIRPGRCMLRKSNGEVVGWVELSQLELADQGACYGKRAKVLSAENVWLRGVVIRHDAFGQYVTRIRLDCGKVVNAKNLVWHLEEISQ